MEILMNIPSANPSASERPIRESNYELLRILCMLMIIAFHTFRYIPVSDFTPWQTALFHAVRWYGLLGVNCYLLISSHFLIGRASSPGKILPLICQTAFYCLLALLGRIIYALATGKGNTLLQDILDSELDALFSPFWANRYWFVTAYLFLWLLLPVYNKLLTTLSEKQYQRFILLLTAFVFFYLSIPQTTENTTVVGDILWVSYVFLLAGYLKLYRPQNLLKKHAGKLLLSLWLLFIITRQLMTYCVHNEHLYYLLYHTTGNSMRYSFFMLLMALCLFYLFQRFHLRSRLVNKISSCTFGVYLFHENKLFHVCELLAVNLRRPFLQWIPSLPLFMFLLVAVQFLTGTLIDLLRQRLFRLFHRLFAAIPHRSSDS